jgi:hypothetical protein
MRVGRSVRAGHRSDLAEPPDEINAEVVRRMEARYADDLPL